MLHTIMIWIISVQFPQITQKLKNPPRTIKKLNDTHVGIILLKLKKIWHFNFLTVGYIIYQQRSKSILFGINSNAFKCTIYNNTKN